MSMDLSVYVKDPRPVSRRDLVEALRLRGWHAVLVDSKKLTPLPPGNLRNETLVAARTPETCEAFRQALSKENNELVEALAEENELGNCGLSLNTDFEVDDVFPGQELKRLARNAGEAFVQRLRSANAEYHIGFRPGCNLAFDVWHVLGSITGGLLEDPQSGAWCEWDAGQLKMLVQPPANTNPFRALFQAAHAQGVPFDPLGGDPLGDMRSDKLEPKALEALLELARKMLPELAFGSIAKMIIADYTAKKGARFVRENGEWVDNLKKRFAVR